MTTIPVAVSSPANPLAGPIDFPRLATPGVPATVPAPTPAVTIAPAGMPPEIEQALLSLPTFDPSLPRKEYTDGKDIWQLYLDLKELDANKLACLIIKHNDDEPAEKLKLRKSLASVVNLVPAVVNLIGLYLFSEEPTIDVKGDPDLTAFVEDCDGGENSFAQFVREQALPLAVLMGHVDVLVQNPLILQELSSAQQAEDAGITPRAFCVTPLARHNWSCEPNGVYQWMRFQDVGAEDANPLRSNTTTPTTYVTLSRACSELQPLSGPARGAWIRSWQPLTKIGSGSPPAPAEELPPGTVTTGGWAHQAGWTPTVRVPVAKLYYQRAIDPKSRGTGVSKVSTIAVLTKQIVQVLSWTIEDMLASLGIIAFPTPGGNTPKKRNTDGTASSDDAVSQLDAFSLLYFSDAAKSPPFVLQGHVDHIHVKLAFVQQNVQEILRQAHLLGTHGEAEKVPSGVSGMVLRTELFRELQDMASALDRWALEVFALVKSWATDEDWDRERLLREVGPTVSFFKGPYTVDAIGDVIKDAGAIIQMFATISPTAAEGALAQALRAYFGADDPKLKTSLAEVHDNLNVLLSSHDVGLLTGEAVASSQGKYTAQAITKDQPSPTPTATTTPASPTPNGPPVNPPANGT